MIEKKYRKYYIYGYINNKNINRTFRNIQDNNLFIKQKIKDTFDYIGIKTPRIDFSKWPKIISFFEVTASSLIVLYRFFIVFLNSLVKSREKPYGLYLIAPLNTAQFRVKDMLRSIDGVEVSAIKIPFIDNEFRDNEIDVLKVITIKDIFDSFICALWMIFFLPYRFGNEDVLFRSYSSFDYFLTCRFVQHIEDNNRIIFYNNYDRWAFLFCNAKKDAIYIQHGKLDYITQLIRVGTPHTAYYISPEQKKVLEDTLFENMPMEVLYRKQLQFTHRVKIAHENGKKNVLIVSASSFIEDVNRIVQLLAEVVNLYVKPHPGEKKLAIYDEFATNHGVILLEKTDYPKVDVVVSYNSTLADEYEMVGIRVIRWDKLKNLSEIRNLVLS